MVAVAGLLSGAGAVASAPPPALVLGALVAALPLGALEVSAAIIGVAREATRAVAARTARMRFIARSPLFS